MIALACLATFVIGYFVGVARGYLLAEQQAGRLDTGPARFDAWDGEPEPDSDSPVACYSAGYRAGVRFELFRAGQIAARSPGVRERAMAEAVGGRELEGGKVPG